MRGWNGAIAAASGAGAAGGKDESQRKVRGMNDDHQELLEGLRALATDGPREAPGHVEEQLQTAFRRQRRRRKLVTWVPPSLAIAAAAAIALLMWNHYEKPQPAPAIAVTTNAPAPVMEEEAYASFYPLPEAEALPALENAMVIRVQLPASSLRSMGVPVGEDRANAAVQAELLLGQDGLARGVRLAE